MAKGLVCQRPKELRRMMQRRNWGPSRLITSNAAVSAPMEIGLFPMDKITSATILSARRQMEVGDYRAALSTLGPLVQTECAEALFLYSTFSVAESESEDEFERRSFSMLARAAELGYVPAIYALAVCYESGDLVDANPELAAKLFESAASSAFPKAMYRHGLNLLHGSNGILLNKQLGLKLLQEAAQNGVEDAQDYLRGR